METKTIPEMIEELKKGCGKKISYPNYHLYCGDSNSLRQVLCVSCKLKLSTLQDFINSKEYADELEKQRFEGIDYGKQEAQKMFLEEIDKLQKKRFEYNSLSVNQFIEELKSKIGEKHDTR